MPTTTVTEYSNEVLYPWKTSLNPVNCKNNHEFTDGGMTPTNGGAGANMGSASGTWFSSAATALNELIARWNANRNGPDISSAGFIGFHCDDGLHGSTPDRIINAFTNTDGTASFPEAVAGELVTLFLHYNELNAKDGYLSVSQLAVGNIYEQYEAALGNKLKRKWFNGWNNYQSGPTPSIVGVLYIQPTYDDVSPPAYAGRAYSTQIYTAEKNGRLGPPTHVMVFTLDMIVAARRVTRAPDNPCSAQCSDSYPEIGSSGFCVDKFGTYHSNAPWANTVGTWKVLSKYATTGTGNAATVQRYPLSPARPSTHADYTSQAFWDAAYAVAVANGDLPAGMTYNAAGSGGVTTYPRTQTFAYQRSYQLSCINLPEITVGQVTYELCKRAGVPIDKIDVAQLTEIIKGYAVS